ncbi:MAG: uracil-DNA glycosylase [Rickettsiales bacterium]|nr:uracil-DNA glycosylase [Rickettsiales bacterium]|tara:strand:+ start:1756 stop:1956 length:201 start_codon:yes stop_codon:yes gene_type:complete
MANNHCKNCLNLYITYKSKFPYGCKAFGIISKNIPYLEVKKISGTDCALFTSRKKNVKFKNRGRLA